MNEENPPSIARWFTHGRTWVLHWLIKIPTTLEVVVLVLAIRLFESTTAGKAFVNWLGIHTFLEIIESVSILAAVFMYLKETPERQKRSHYEAWKVIDAAYGKRNSFARIQALQDLNEDGVSLRGLDAPKADLREVNLPRAVLLGANLQRSDLLEADLHKADLRAANLQRANLQRANLYRADLRATLLIEANLLGADLRHANMKGADLQGAKLRGVNLTDALLTGANLKGADFRVAENLTLEQVQSAQNWTEALYDVEISDQLGLPPAPNPSTITF